MWCMATFGLRFRMLIVTFPNLLMKVLKDSPFSWRMPTKAMEVRWCDRLVANCVSNMDISVAKLSTELGGSFVNQLKAPPFSNVGNTQHRTVSFEVYKLMWVVYASMCSYGSIVPSQRSLLKPFHLFDSGTPIIESVKGCRHTEFEVPIMQTLSLVSSVVFGLGGEVNDLPTRLVGTTDGPPSMNFLFFASFSLLRARICSSFFLATSSMFLLILAISLCRDINNVICSASVILSLAGVS